MAKSPEEDMIEIDPDAIRTLNGAFSFKGKVLSGAMLEIATSFYDWCEEMEKTHGVVITSNRVDYNGYWPIDRTRMSKEK